MLGGPFPPSYQPEFAAFLGLTTRIMSRDGAHMEPPGSGQEGYPLGVVPYAVGSASRKGLIAKALPDPSPVRLRAPTFDGSHKNKTAHQNSEPDQKEIIQRGPSCRHLRNAEPDLRIQHFPSPTPYRIYRLQNTNPKAVV